MKPSKEHTPSDLLSTTTRYGLKATSCLSAILYS